MRPIRFELQDAPLVGTTFMGQQIWLGGFSGLRYLGRSPAGLYRFVTHTDRGPNADERGRVRPFGLPDFQPRLVFLEADLESRRVSVTHQLPLVGKNRKPLSGRPPGKNSEIAVDFKNQPLAADNEGLDLEGIALAPDGTYWMADEYGPSLVHFSAEGVLLDKLSPGNGLPEGLCQRRLNRGFESIAISRGHLFAGLESPPEKSSHVTTIVEVDPVRRVTVAQHEYIMDEADSGKLGDFTFVGKDQLLVLEKGKDWKRVYRATLGGTKVLEIDLTAAGFTEEKAEGIDLVEGKYIAIVTDNDFGLAGGLDRGIAETKIEPPALYFFPLETN